MSTPLELHEAALRAAERGDLQALVSFAGAAALRVRVGAPKPSALKWLWDPNPVLAWEPPIDAPPLSLGGPHLLQLWEDQDQHEAVAPWLGKALGRMYRGDWGKLGKLDAAANERSLKDGSRLMGVYPWFGKDEKNKDLWIFVEAAHGEDVRFRRVSVVHRIDY